MSYIIKNRPNQRRQSRQLTLTSRVMKVLEGLPEIYPILHFEMIISSFIYQRICFLSPPTQN